MQYRTLGRTGLEVSVLGFGAAPLGDEYGSIDETEGERAVHLALDRGVNFVDVAPYYGRTLAEERLGRALVGRRDEVVLATKCCRDGSRRFDFSAERVRASLDESLARLRTDRIDLFQVHDIEFGERARIVDETLPAMREMQAAGKARFIGITGLPIRMLREVAAEFPVDTILTYCHGNLLASDALEVLGTFAAERGVGLINASPLHMGILSPGGPQDWHPAPDEVKEAGRRIVALCRERGRNPAEVALRWSLDRTEFATTLVGMRDRHEVEANLAALEADVDEDLLAEIAAIVAPVRDRPWHEGLPENAP